MNSGENKSKSAIQGMKKMLDLAEFIDVGTDQKDPEQYWINNS